MLAHELSHTVDLVFKKVDDNLYDLVVIQKVDSDFDRLSIKHEHFDQLDFDSPVLFIAEVINSGNNTLHQHFESQLFIQWFDLLQ